MTATTEDRTDRRPCPSCEASAKGCHGVHLVAGRYCCPDCDGWHDEETKP